MALLRVKRRLQDDPIDVLLLSCKKPKTEEDSVTKVFKFAATVDDQDGDIKKHITEVKSAKRHPLKYREHNVSAITEKLRAENKLSSHDNRLKVVNWFRAVGDGGKLIGEEDTYTIVDVVNTDNTKTSTATSGVIDKNSQEVSSVLTDEQYVYDLYYSAVGGGDFDDLQMENLLSVHEVNEELIFGDFMEAREDDIDDEEDDSNDENNWRNDYPDEMSDEDFSSDDENLMRLAVQMKNVAVDDEYRSELSSDEGDSLLVYSEQDPDFYYHSESSRSESSLSYYSTD